MLPLWDDDSLAVNVMDDEEMGRRVRSTGQGYEEVTNS